MNAPYTMFGKTVMLPVKIYLNGKRIDNTTEWDEEFWIERDEEWYALGSLQFKNRKVRVIEGKEFRKALSYV